MSVQMIPGQILQHFKGGFYKVLTVGKDADTGEEIVVYIALEDGETYTRKAYRFEEIVEWPDGTKRARFIVNSPKMEKIYRERREVPALELVKSNVVAEGDPQTAHDILSIVCEEILPLEAIERWTPAQRIEAERWARVQHHLASDNEVDEIPPMPVHVRKLREQSPKQEWAGDVSLEPRGTSPAGDDDEKEPVSAL